MFVLALTLLWTVRVRTELPLCDMLSAIRDYVAGIWVPPDGEDRVWHDCPATQITLDPSDCHRLGHDPPMLVWRPHSCRLLQFDAVGFLRALNGRQLDVVGDSLSDQHFQNMKCLLEGAEALLPRTLRGKVASLLHWNRTSADLRDVRVSIRRHWIQWLFNIRVDVKKVARPAWRPYARGHESRNEVLLVNTGAWYSRYQAQQNKLPENCSSSEAVERMFKEHVEFYLDNTLADFHGVTIFRTISPGHTEHCNGTYSPLFDWDMFKVRNSFLRSTIAQRRHRRILLLDIEAISDGRSDAHPASVGVNQDCMHWCSPGPTSVTNTWMDLLFNMVVQLHAANWTTKGETDSFSVPHRGSDRQ